MRAVFATKPFVADTKRAQLGAVAVVCEALLERTEYDVL